MDSVKHGSKGDKFLVLIRVLAVTVLLSGAVNCSLYSKAAEDGTVEVGVSSHQETEEIDVSDSFGAISPVIDNDPGMECRGKMDYLELAVIEYHDSLGCYPSSLEDAWDCWWSQRYSGSICSGFISSSGGFSYELTSTLPMCPENPESYTYDYTSDSYTITCSYGHGSIKDGVSSWD